MVSIQSNCLPILSMNYENYELQITLKSNHHSYPMIMLYLPLTVRKIEAVKKKRVCALILETFTKYLFHRYLVNVLMLCAC